MALARLSVKEVRELVAQAKKDNEKTRKDAERLEQQAWQMVRKR